MTNPSPSAVTTLPAAMIYAVIDLETTGLTYPEDAIVEIAAALCCEGRVVDTFRTLVNPERDIPANVMGVHHIRVADVVDAPKRADAVAKLLAFIAPARAYVAHNAEFDGSFLPEIDLGRWLCTMRLARHLCPESPDFKLQTLRYHLGVDDRGEDLGTTSHSALADVRATAAVLFELLEKARTRYGSQRIGWLMEFARSPVALARMPRGNERSRGKSFSELPDRDLWYWISRGDIDRDLRFTIEQELYIRLVAAGRAA